MLLLVMLLLLLLLLLLVLVNGIFSKIILGVVGVIKHKAL